MTEYEKELDPYYDLLMEEEKKTRRWQKALPWIFDRLQTGQYISANVANEIVDALDRNPDTTPEILKAIYEGISGERKGSYENLLRDRLHVGEQKIFKNAPEGSRRSEIDWATVFGFIGDVLLDPTTWTGIGGATKAAQASARAFADDAVRLTLKQLVDEPGQIVAKTLGNIDPKKIQRVLAIADTNKGISKLKGLGDDLGRFIDMTYREAYRTALNRTPGELVEKSVAGGLDEITSLGRYSDAGERYGIRFMGKEGLKHQGGAPSRAVSDTWERFSRWFSGTPESPTKFRKAVWGAFNRGPIGEMRRALGFRNPYQKYLRAQELETKVVGGRVAASDSLRESFDVLDGLSDEQVDLLKNTMSAQEEKWVKAMSPEATPGQSAMLEAIDVNIVTSGDEAVDRAAYKLKRVFDEWHEQEADWARILGEDPADYREWYMPTRFRDTGGSTHPRQARKYTYKESFGREVELQQALWGVDRETAQRIVDRNISGFATDFKEILAERALVHGKIKARAELIDQMKEFGINLADTEDVVGQALQRGGRDFTSLGVKNIESVPSLSNYVFDYDVADIIERAVNVTGKQKNVFARGMARFANWWKGMATATPGFHMRNFISNNVTQFLRHGTRAFDFDTYMMSIAGVAATLAENSRKAFLGQVNLDEKWFAKYLNRRIGNKTIKELASEARTRGVISEATMGFEARDVVEKITRTGKRQRLREGSRAVGNYIENIPRFQSFLIDYKDTFVKANTFPDLSGDALESALAKADAAKLDWASQEAKKWFIDYEDLSEFEQTWMKSTIPFYTWIRRNLANQISGIALYPDLYSIMPKIEDFIASEDPDYDPAFIPEWLREGGAFPLRQLESGAFRMFRPDFAHTDLNLIPLSWEEGRIFPRFTPEELKDEVINATAPWIRRMADWMLDRDQAYNFFYKNDLGPTSDAPYLMRLFASRPGTVPLVDGLLRFFRYENGAHMDEQDGKLKIDSRMALVLEEYLPVLRQLEFLFYLPQTAMPRFEELLERVTLSEDDYEGAEQIMQLMSYYLGVKTKEQDLEQEKMRLGRDIYYQATEALSEARRQDPSRAQNRLENQRRLESTIRRLNG